MRVQNQMLILRVMAAGFLIAGSLFGASPAAADDGKICLSDVANDVVIAACTRAIASGQYTTQNVVTLYNSRGIAYGYKGQPDRAVQDFEQAIRLDPQFAQGDRSNSVAVGDGRFIVCCRAILLDHRDATSWTIKDIRGNANDQQCVETCLKNLRR